MRKLLFFFRVYMRDSEALACASMQSDQGLQNFLIESLDAVEYLNGQLGADKTVRMHIQCQANSLHIRAEGPDQTAHMRSLIRALLPA